MNLLSKYTGKNETTSFSNFDMATVLKGASSPIEQGDLLARFCGMTNLHFFIAPNKHCGVSGCVLPLAQWRNILSWITWIGIRLR